MANLKPRKYRPLLRWHGGKWRLALWILEFFPRHHLYTEVYGGAASVLLRKPRSKGEVYNDLDQTLVALFRVLRNPDQAAELIRLLTITPYAEEEFRNAYRQTDDEVEAARRTIVRSYMGYGGDGTSGKYSTGFRATVTSHLKLPAQEWAAYPEALRIIVERMRAVTIMSRPALEVLELYDAPGTLHYVDPPYLPATRSQGNRRRGAGYHVYEHELSTEDHVVLLDKLNSLQGMVVLSGYPSAIYDDALPGWERHEREAFADGGRPRREVIWINPAASAARLTGKRPRGQTKHPGPLFTTEEDNGDGGEPGEVVLCGRGGDDGRLPGVVDVAA